MTGDEATLGVHPGHDESITDSGAANGRSLPNNVDSVDQQSSVTSMTQNTPNGQSGTDSTSTPTTGQQPTGQQPKANGNTKRQGAPIDPKLLEDVVAMFAPFDDEWSSTTRSIRIDGTVTSVRLENFFWRILGDMAKEQELQIPQMLTRLSKIARSGETSHSNFTSFIRVCCGRYIDARLAADNGGQGQAMHTATGVNAQVPHGI